MEPLAHAAFEALLSRGRDYVLLLDPASRLLAASRSFVDAFAGGGPDPVGSVLLDRLDPASRARAVAVLADLGDEPRDATLGVVGPDGRPRPVRFTFLRLDAPDGRRAVLALGRERGDAHRLVESVVSRNRDLERDRERLERQASTDPLTGLVNRRRLLGRLAALWATARREGRSCWVVMADVDHFKGFNDVHGHALGDAVLRAVAAALQAAVRRGDLAARYGGEEFCLAGPCSGPDEALAIAGRLLAAVRAVRVPCGPASLGVTASLGVATVDPALHPDPRTALRAADAALYRAKSSGRDRLALADPIPDPA